jgi:hypothetical protein
MTFSLQTHVKGRLDKGYYKVFLLSCSSGFHTQRLMDELGPYLMNAGHDTTFIELQIYNHMVDTVYIECEFVINPAKTAVTARTPGTSPDQTNPREQQINTRVINHLGLCRFAWDPCGVISRDNFVRHCSAGV